MSFRVEGTTITMHRGDTGEMTVTASGYAFESTDRALFTIKDATGTVIKKTYYEMEDNAFTVEFTNPDTDYLPAGIYSWDVRYIINPEYDSGGEIIDGDGVTTPGSPYQLNLLNTVGQV